MDTNKSILLALIFTFILLSIGNMGANFYFMNRAINLVTAVAPPLTLSNAQTQMLKNLVKQERK